MMLSEPEILMREYSSAAAYRQDLQRLQRSGWTIASTLERRPRTTWADRLTLGLAARMRGPERLVTFTRLAGARSVGSAVAPQQSASPTPALVPAGVLVSA